MSTPRKKTPSRPLPAGQRLPQKGRGKKKRKKSALPQIIGGATLAIAIGGVMAVGAYLASQSLPKDQAATQAAPLARPSVQPLLRTIAPKRPGLVACMPDEVYFPSATDLAGSPDAKPVGELLARGVVTVFADGKFRAQLPIPRAEFVAWCYNAVMAQSASGPDPFVIPRKGFTPVTPTGAEFGDVAADHWAAPVLATVQASGILGEAGRGYFRPDAPLTREEWLVLASRFASPKSALAALKPPTAEALAVGYRKLNYTDLAALRPAFRAYAGFVFDDDQRERWVSETFTPPVNLGPWHPDAAVTRGEAADWIAAAYNQIGKDSF